MPIYLALVQEHHNHVTDLQQSLNANILGFSLVFLDRINEMQECLNANILGFSHKC